MTEGPYNYPNYHPKFYRVDQFNGPKKGERYRDFEVLNDNGDVAYISDFLNQPLVLEMGSMTCPMYGSNVAPNQELVREFPEFNFAVLYVREAHPGNVVTNHTSLEEKRAASRSAKDLHGDARVHLIDNLDGPAHRFYGALPNSIYVIGTDGTILFSDAWNNAHEMRAVLNELRQTNAISDKTALKMAVPRMNKVAQTLTHAGLRSVFDFVIHAPRLMWEHARAGHFKR